MAAGNTYTPIATVTLGASGTITFTSIPQTYTDLILIFNGGITNTGWDAELRLNNDSAANYDGNYTYGDGTSATSGKYSNSTRINCGGGGDINTLNYSVTMQFLNYSNTSTYKTVLTRSNTPSYNIFMGSHTYRSSSAISTIFLYCGASNNGTANLYAGSTATLYGIAAA